jgi:hypothetical protein
MKLEKSHIEDLRNLSRGGQVAYVDRLRRRYRGPSAFPPPDSGWLLPVSDDFRKMIHSRGWSALYSAEAWTKHIRSTLAFLGTAVWGFAADVSVEASLWISRKTGFARQEATLSVLESIFPGSDHRPHATVRCPSPGGGWSRHAFRLVSDSDVMISLGRSVEFIPPSARSRARLRPLSPPSSLGENGSTKHMSVSELAGIVSAQYSMMDFAGVWDRVALPSAHLGAKCLSPRLAGLFVNRATSEAVLVFSGTHPASAADWVVNIATSHAKKSYQHSRAVTTTLAARSQYPRLLLAGHSKGGGLAQFASATTGLPAVTFNSVGLPLSQLGLARSPSATVEHFMVKYDPVSNFSGRRFSGSMGITGPLANLRGLEQRLLGGQRSIRQLPPPKKRHRVYWLHSMEAIKTSLRENPFVIPNPFDAVRSKSLPLKGLAVDPAPGIPFAYEPLTRQSREPRRISSSSINL